MLSLLYWRASHPDWWQLWAVSRMLPYRWIVWQRREYSLQTFMPTVSAQTVDWWLFWVAIPHSLPRVSWSIPVRHRIFLPLQVVCVMPDTVLNIIMEVMPTLRICVPIWCLPVSRILFPIRTFPYQSAWVNGERMTILFSTVCWKIWKLRRQTQLRQKMPVLFSRYCKPPAVMNPLKFRIAVWRMIV